MENFESLIMADKVEEKEEKPKRTKSRFFYSDTYYKDEKRKELMKDPDVKAFYKDKW